jgi:2-polyprenyl-6-methoxyphenol hydroxylase-like FAD-dependent oxidoreductase
MCFEDAHQLGLAMAARGVDPSAIQLFERVRIPRANMVQWESNTYYKRQFERNTSEEWRSKFLNFQKYVRDAPDWGLTVDGNGHVPETGELSA